MSKKIYFVHEENKYANFDKMKIKLASTKKKEANDFYNENKHEYGSDESWNLVLSEYEFDKEVVHIGSNILRDLITIKTTNNE